MYTLYVYVILSSSIVISQHPYFAACVFSAARSSHRMKIIEKRKQEEGEEINEEDLEKEFDAEEMQKKVAHKCDSSIDSIVVVSRFNTKFYLIKNLKFKQS